MKSITIYRGDSFYKALKLSQIINAGSIIKYAILKDKKENYVYINEIVLNNKNNNILLEIPAEETAQFPIGKFIFEIEITYSGIVKTKEFEIEIKADGIRERGGN